ncbi:MAG TPA: sulfatase [Bacteroidia bacterium]|jgi:uncharacterized sulfatase|nr:sulfatase [Bacteroidia bacterium]
MTSAQQRPPNIILILADDLGYGDLSCFGQKQWQTPNIDELANDGVRLTSMYTPVPYCAPTRASLLTGRYPQRHKLVTNPNPEKIPNFQKYRGGDSIGLQASEYLISQFLKESGYATKIIGKWHLGHKPSFLPTRRGFDEYLGIPYSNDMRPVILMENEKTIEYPVVQATLTQRYTEASLEFIEKNKNHPFFLYLPQAMPHKPLAVSEQFYTPETKNDLYADALRELDWSVGQVMKKVKDLGLEGNTIILFLSDNGPWFGGSTGGLRGMKSQNWEGGIRVPFIARWKNHLPAGLTNTQPVGIIDIFPTIASLINKPLPSSIVFDGKDISTLLKDEKAKSPHEFLFSFNTDQLHTVRWGKWKLHIRTPEPYELPEGDEWIDPRWPDGVTILAPSEQPKANAHPGITTGDQFNGNLLFDLEADPSEQRNVADKYPDIVKRLLKYANEANIDLNK